MSIVDDALDQSEAAAKREANAIKAKQAKKILLPKLKHWNYAPCKHHETPQPDCAYRECGGPLFDHQTVAVMYLYLRKRGLLADSPGLGKTNSLLALLCLLKERGELQRTIVVINTPAVMQWYTEAQRFAPGLKVEAVPGGMPKKKRLERYSNSWDVLFIGNHMMSQDIDLLLQLKPGMAISDDVDALLNHGTKTHKNFLKLSSTADRVIIMNASSVQQNIKQLHASMMPITGYSLWGSLPMFERRFVKMEWNKYWVTEQGVRRQRSVQKAVGIQDGDALRSLIYPWVLRRTYADVASDIHMPDLMPPTNVWLDMYPRQRAKYEELREGVLTIQHASGSLVKKQARALAAFVWGSQICCGLAALGEADGAGQSVKLDWLMYRITQTWTDGEKLVVFCPYKPLVSALQGRLRNAGIGSAVIWGDNKKSERQQEQQRFWDDPNCRVIIGTSAIERSLNLQNANIVVNIGMIMNPERMRQILGRVRRAGSSHDKVFQFNLFCTDSQEDKYLQVLSEREAVNSFVWDDESGGIFPKLSHEQMLALIRR